MEKYVDEWSDSYKTEEDLYLEALSEEGLKVDDLIKRLIEEGHLNEEQYIQIGANSGWIWIGKIGEYDEFLRIAEKEFKGAKKAMVKLQNAIDDMWKQIPKFNREKKNVVAYVSEFGTMCRIFGTRLQALSEELRMATRTVKYGSFERRKVIEVYKSIQINKNALMIRMVGDESGAYWDVDEKKGKNDGKVDSHRSIAGHRNE